jgi:tetratricopeptide (TPR) repeat protein
MTAQPSWERVAALFDQALERPQPERAAWLAAACGDDEALRREVEQLLAAHDRAEGVLDRPLDSVAAEAIDEAQNPAAPDEQVGPYRIVSEIGRGGMGVVYKAEDPRLGRYVALKFLSPDLTGSAQAKRRLLAEARAASVLDHPNICTVYDVGETGDKGLFFAMAYYEGQTLGERLEQGPLSVNEALGIGMQVAAALDHAHQAGVVHRDVKPSNIFLTTRGEAKVLDFGLAKQGWSTLTDPGTRIGTLAYMSPEQAMGKPVDHRTDLWSLGVVLYEMVAGRKPFQGENGQALLYAILNEPLLTERPLPAAWSRIVQRALEKQPEHRYQSARDLREELQDLQEALEQGSTQSEIVAAVPAGAASPRSVGRERELAELRAAYQGCAAGRGAVLCITGEPGMGKTTLVEDFLAGLTANPPSCCMARGRCSERLAGSDAYLPVLEALESLTESEARDLVVRLMKEKAPTWYVQIAPLAAGADASFAAVLADVKVASQERMKRELTVFFQELSRRRPVVLFWDDLHWADVSTVDVLSYLGSRCDALRLLLLATYRPSDLHLAKHPFLQVQRELQGRGLCQEISLDFLGERDITRYLEREFPDHRFPSFLASLVRSRTEGNPLFVVELVRYLRDRGVIAEQDGHWVLAQSAQQIQRDLPESIRGMIARKLDRLEEEDRRLLDAAAVQGQQFDSATVARVLDGDVSLVEERLADLGRRHRLVQSLEEKEHPDGTLTQRYGFVHVLYQNALYAALPARRKATWSAAVAEALLAFWGQESGRVAVDLAYLFEAARQFDRAADHFLLAARHAASLYANEEAALLAGRAISCARKLRGPERLPRLLEAANYLGRLHMTLSRLPEALADFELAERTAAEMGDPETHVNAICSAALVLFNTRQADRTREYAGHALEIARAAGSERAAASAEVVLGLERLSYGATDEAEERFRRSVPILQEKGPPLHAMEALGFAGLMHAWELDYEAADRDVSWTFRRARDLGAPYLIIMNLFVRGMARFNRGRLSEGLHDLQEGMRLAELNNERYWLTRYPNTLGWAYRELQDLETALRYDADGVQAARDNRYPKPHAFSHLNLANDYMTLGETHRALEHLQESERIFNLDFWFRWRYSICLNAQIARYWLRRGDTQKAGHYAAESLAVAEPRRQRKHAAWAHKLLGDVAVAEERFADSRREYETALRTLRGHHCPVVEWKILLAAAEMAAAYRDVPLAEHYRVRCQAVIHELADSLLDDRLRQNFLRSERISRALL